MSSNNRSQTVTFRLPNEICEAVDVMAAAQGISRGHWVRGQVLAAASRSNKEELEAVLNDLVATNVTIEKRLHELQRAFIRHLYYTLTRVGAVEHAAAESLAKEKLFPGGE
jgi:hypothetical protein